LFNLLLRNTVMARGNSLRLYQGARAKTYLLGSQSGLMAPVALHNGRFLDVRIGLEMRGGEHRQSLKVTTSIYQYQSDLEGHAWIFRYEYARHPSDPHPPTHFHVRGRLVEDCLREGETLERIHFPASTRVSLEAVIRLLIDQFHVRSTLRRNDWRKLVTQTEREFLRIAHRAISGRAR
jgi:hypothetical protein